MNVPRRLYSTVPYEQTTLETLRGEGEGERLYLICPEGGELHDLEVARLGIQEYLAKHPVEVPEAAPEPSPAPPEEKPEEKAVEQSTVEDKAVEGPSTPAPPSVPRRGRAVDFPPETSR